MVAFQFFGPPSAPELNLLGERFPWPHTDPSRFVDVPRKDVVATLPVL
jgi:hypothetical protein